MPSMDNRSNRFCIAIHGGASMRTNTIKENEISIRNIVSKGYKALEQGASAVDAVEISIRELEDNPLYNAGNGCCLTAIGTVELDAMIMDGTNNKLGSVGCINFASNPISIARLVMDKSPHCLLVGEGAKYFAEENGYKSIDSSILVTESSKKEFEKFKDFKTTLSNFMNIPKLNIGCDTVGAVALDKKGNIACGTSSGGICGKMPGRIGDSPLVGCGGFANKYGAASCTGHGESLMKEVFCREVVRNIESSIDPTKSAKSVLIKIFDETKSCGGVVCLNAAGEIGVYHTSEFMPWASYHSIDGIKTFYESFI